MVKLSVSNLAWSDRDEEIFSLLASQDVTGIEVAPGKIAPWGELSVSTIEKFRQRVADYDLEISSFQAFLFGKPHLQLLGDKACFSAFCEHMQFVSELGAAAGAQVLVFGAPKNRLLLEHTEENGRSLLLERLLKLADIAASYEVTLGLEAVPAEYGAELMKSYRETLALVRAADHKGLVFHLDVGCTWVHGDDVGTAIREASTEIAHFHVSQPMLSDFSDPAPYHQAAGRSLQDIGYEKWVCLEMLQTPDPASSLKSAIEYVKRTYLGNSK